MLKDLQNFQVFVIRNGQLRHIPYTEVLDKFVRLWGGSYEEAHYLLLDFGYSTKIESESYIDSEIGTYSKQNKACPVMAVGNDLLIPFIVQEDVEGILNLHESTSI